MKRARSGGPVVVDDPEGFTEPYIRAQVAQLLSQTDWDSKQYAKVYGLPDSYSGGQGDEQSSIQQISGMYASVLNRLLERSQLLHISLVPNDFANKQGVIPN